MSLFPFMMEAISISSSRNKIGMVYKLHLYLNEKDEMEERYREVKATKNLKTQAQRACLHLGEMKLKS
jgi:hypothetical protein